MFRSVYRIFFLFCIVPLTLFSQETSEIYYSFKPFYRDINPGNTFDEVFDDSISLLIYENELWCSYQEVNTLGSFEVQFTDKQSAIAFLDCEHFFEPFHDTIKPLIRVFAVGDTMLLKGVNTIHFIDFVDFGRPIHLVWINRSSMYEALNNIDFYLSKREVLMQEGLRYFETVDTSCQVNVIREGVVDTLIEEVLVKQHYRRIDVVSESEFEERQNIVVSTYSDCPEAIVDTFDLVFEMKSESKKIVPIHAQFETITEEIAVYSGLFLLERNINPLDSLIERDLINVKMAEECNWPPFLDRLDYEVIRDTLPEELLQMSYEACPKGSKPLGIYCITDTSQSVNLIFGTLNKRLLAAPATYSEEIVPAEYQSVMVTQVVNRHELDSACIMERRDTFVRNVLVEDPQIELVDIPAEYKTVKRYISRIDPILEYDCQNHLIPLRSGIRKKNAFVKLPLVEDCKDLKGKVLEKLIALDILENERVSNKEYLQALINYQLDNGFKAGVLSWDFLQHLGISP